MSLTCNGETRGRPASSGRRTERAACVSLLGLIRRASALRDVPHHLVELVLRDLAAGIPPAKDLGRAVMVAVPVSAVHRVDSPTPSTPTHPAPEYALGH